MNISKKLYGCLTIVALVIIGVFIAGFTVAKNTVVLLDYNGEIFEFENRSDDVFEILTVNEVVWDDSDH